MGRAKKVVLAYSGGVDTSVCIPYLKQEWGVDEVITFAADLGQGDELEPIRLKALDAGPLDEDEMARIRRIGEHIHGTRGSGPPLTR